MAVGMKVLVDTSGFDGLVSEAKTRSITLKGVRAGIKVLVGPAKAGAPKRSGALKQAQGYKAAKGRRGKTIAYAAQGAKTAVQKKLKGGKVAKPSFYDHLVQGGTQPHATKKGSRLARTTTTKSSENYRPGRGDQTAGRHPGAKPNPYRRRAYQSNRDAIARACNAAMGEELQKVMAREAAKVKV